MDLRIALAGNPNSGKTTLFNALTGSTQFVGNWPGVTVEKKEGRLQKHDGVIITDPPGIYSLSPYTLAHIAVLGFVPQMLVLFLLLAILEDCGYMCVFAYVISLIVFQVGKTFAGGISMPDLIVALILLGCIVWQLVRPYKESTRLTQEVRVK